MLSLAKLLFLMANLVYYGKSIVNTTPLGYATANQVTQYGYLPVPKPTALIALDETASVDKYPHQASAFALQPSLISLPHYQPSIQPLQLSENSLLTALLLSAVLGVPSVKHNAVSNQEHLPVNPYITLLLSQYGRYLPTTHTPHAKGLYYYAASNNYHNNKPFGSYKVNESAR